MTPTQQLAREARSGWAAPPKETLSEWAESHFRLSPEYSAATGKLTLYGYQREPLDSFTNPYVREIVIMSATQMLKTLCLQVSLAYAIARDPGPILLAQPSEADAETFSKERIGPMVRDIEALRSRVAPEKRTSKSNTILHKVFPGGTLSMVGAQTPGNFARRSIRYFFADERDKWPKNVGKEGDGFSLGVKRTATFRSRAKIVQVCSPTIEGDSQIAAAYEASDQRKFWVPCHSCGERHILKWENVKWEAQAPRETAHYGCPFCGTAWNDPQRWEACQRGEWRAEKPFRGVAGFWISELYSPWKTIGDMVEDFVAKKDNPAELQTFVNTSLAELWRQPGEEPANWEALKGRKEEYLRGEAPQGVLFVTAGADVQKDRIVIDFWGWGRGKQRWFLDRQVLMGDTSRAEVWQQFDVARAATFHHPSGLDMSVVQGAIDSGYATAEVYAWARGKRDWIVTKGQSSGPALVGQPQAAEITRNGKRIQAGVRVWPVNVSMAKAELYGQLRQPKPEAVDGEVKYPAGWVHFPGDAEEEWFRELCAERYVTRVVKGYRKGEWVKERERNEALDCGNYARAAASHFGIDRSGNHWWEAWEAHVGTVRKPKPEPTTVETTLVAPPPVVAAQQQSRTGRRVRFRMG